jgi:hypothetical protein
MLWEACKKSLGKHRSTSRVYIIAHALIESGGASPALITMTWRNTTDLVSSHRDMSDNITPWRLRPAGPGDPPDDRPLRMRTERSARVRQGRRSARARPRRPRVPAHTDRHVLLSVPPPGPAWMKPKRARRRRWDCVSARGMCGSWRAIVYASKTSSLRLARLVSSFALLRTQYVDVGRSRANYYEEWSNHQQHHACMWQLASFNLQRHIYTKILLFSL